MDVEKLDKIEAVTKAHIALNTIENPKNKEKLLVEFGHIPSKGEFIETIMNENCPAYVKKESLTPKEAAEIIRAAKGKVVLAHPVAYVHEDNFTEEDILAIVNDMKPDGLEANYLYFDGRRSKSNIQNPEVGQTFNAENEKVYKALRVYMASQSKKIIWAPFSSPNGIAVNISKNETGSLSIE